MSKKYYNIIFIRILVNPNTVNPINTDTKVTPKDGTNRQKLEGSDFNFCWHPLKYEIQRVYFSSAPSEKFV